MDPVTAGLILGGVSTGAGLLNSWLGSNAADKAADAQLAAAYAAIKAQEDAYNEVSPFFDQYKEQGDEAFSRLSAGILNGDFDLPERGDFEYNKTTQDFLDPSMAYQLGVANDALEASQAGGGLKSGATLSALQKNAQDYAMIDFGNANSRMVDDRNFNYNDFLNQFTSKTNAINSKFNNLSGLSKTGYDANVQLGNMRTGLGNAQASSANTIGNIQAIQAQIPYQAGMNAVNGITSGVGAGIGAYQQGTQNQQLLDLLKGASTSGTLNFTAPTSTTGTSYFGMPVSAGNLA